jgi:hypothetical protein
MSDIEDILFLRGCLRSTEAQRDRLFDLLTELANYAGHERSCPALDCHRRLPCECGYKDIDRKVTAELEQKAGR